MRSLPVPDATIMIPGSFDSACSNVEQYAERTTMVFSCFGSREFHLVRFHTRSRRHPQLE